MMASINRAQSANNYAPIVAFVQGKPASSGECGVLSVSDIITSEGAGG